MNSDPRDYEVDISSLSESQSTARPQSAPAGRPYLSVLFECCSVYQRVYREVSDHAYVARCPRCGLTARFPVGATGTAARTFRVG